MEKKVLMVIASNIFRDEEYFEPKKILNQAGIKVVTASSGLNEATGTLGAKVKPEVLLSEVKSADYDAVVFVGGAGSREYWNDKKAHAIAKETLAQGKTLAAICIAPVTLARAGVLKNKKATVFPEEKDALMDAGAKYISAPAVQDGNIITASGPGAAGEFGRLILKNLTQNQ